jgi:hypothetical protein
MQMGGSGSTPGRHARRTPRRQDKDSTNLWLVEIETSRVVCVCMRCLPNVHWFGRPPPCLAAYACLHIYTL